MDYILPDAGHLQWHLEVHALRRTPTEEMITFLQSEHLFHTRNNLWKCLRIKLFDAVSMFDEELMELYLADVFVKVLILLAKNSAN